MRTQARAPAVAAVTPLAIMLADARAPAVLAPAPLAVMRADARAPAVLAGAPLAVMRADARAPTVLAFALFAPLVVMLAGAATRKSLCRRGSCGGYAGRIARRAWPRIGRTTRESKR